MNTLINEMFDRRIIKYNEIKRKQPQNIINME